MHLDTGGTMFNSLTFHGFRLILMAGLLTCSVSGFAQDDLIWNSLDPDNTVYREIAIVRDDKVMIAHHDTVIEADDHVILFMTDRRKIEKLESLFQVGVSFV